MTYSFGATGSKMFPLFCVAMEGPKVPFASRSTCNVWWGGGWDCQSCPNLRLWQI